MLLAVGAIGSLSAQRSLSGVVKNSADDKGVPFANIALLRASDSTFLRGTTSDANGNFSIMLDTVATFLRVSVIGFEAVYQTVDEEAAHVDIVLKEGATTLNEVNIVAKKPMYAADGEKKIYNVSEDPTVQNGTAQDALQNAPGVEIDAEGHITLNGKAVTVYINDRESHFDSVMLRQYIKTLTADQISSIEAIEFPSAKYGGGGPVVNIRTDQKVQKNSYISFGANGSSRPSLSPFISYSYASEKLRLNTYLRFSRDHWEDHGSGDGRYFDEDSILVRDYSYSTSGSSLNYGFQISTVFSYEFDTMNSLSGYISLNPNWHNSETSSDYTRQDFSGGAMQDYSYLYGYEYHSFSDWGHGSIDFKHKFDNRGHEISFSIHSVLWYHYYKSKEFRHYAVQPQMDYDDRWEFGRPLRPFPTFDIHYSWPYSDKGELSAGVTYSNENYINNACRDTLDSDGIYHIDYIQSDSNETFSQDASLYLSWRRKLGHFTLRLGTNMGYETSSVSHVSTSEYDTNTSHFTIRPNILLMYNTESMHTFCLNFTTSTSYPSAFDLSRFPEYNPDSWSTGNPDLKPSHSYSLGVSYDKSFERGHSVGINGNYEWEFDEVSSITVPAYDSYYGRYVSFTKPYNAGDSRNGNIYLYARWRFSAYFTLGLSSGIRDNWYRIMVRPDEWFEDQMTSWNIRVNASAKLFNLVWVSANTHYNSRSHGWSSLSLNEPSWGVDISASADLFNRMLSLYLNINDLFNTETQNQSSINPYMPSVANKKNMSQYITFGVTLRFGKMELRNSGQEGIQAASNNGGGR